MSAIPVMTHRPEAVLCDAIGTMLRLDRPIERLRGQLAARGLLIPEEQAVRALAAEVAAYREHHLDGVDAASITALRRHCAEALRAEIPGLDAERAYLVVMGLVRFELLPETHESLGALKDAGLRLAVVSNWDASLEGTLLAVGLRQYFDVVVSSAAVGAAKPSPAPLLRACELLGVAPDRAVMIGDEEVDARAAEAAGMACVKVEAAAGIAEATASVLRLPV